MSISRRTFVSALFAAPVVAQAAVANVFTKPQRNVGRGNLTSIIHIDDSPWMSRDYFNEWTSPQYGQDGFGEYEGQPDPAEYIAVEGLKQGDTPTIQFYNTKTGRWTVVADVPGLWIGTKAPLSHHPQTNAVVIHHIPRYITEYHHWRSGTKMTTAALSVKHLGG